MSCTRSFWVRFSPDSLYTFVHYLQAGQDICRKIILIEPQDACEEIDQFFNKLCEERKNKCYSELNNETTDNPENQTDKEPKQ